MNRKQLSLYTTILVLLITCWGTHLWAGETSSTPQPKVTPETGAASASAESSGTPRAVFPVLGHEFEPVLEGASVTHTFKVENQGTGELNVLKVSTG